MFGIGPTELLVILLVVAVPCLALLAGIGLVVWALTRRRGAGSRPPGEQ